jgi:hypothetical protein
MKNYWIVLDHPQNLAISLLIARYLRKRNFGKPRLIISKHDYWKKVDLGEFKDHYGRIIKFSRLDFPPRGMPIWKQLLASLLLFFQLAIQKQRVKRLKIGNKDCLISFASTQFLANLILKEYKKINTVNILAEGTYSGFNQEIDFRKYRYSIGSFITTNIIQPLISMLPSYRLVRKTKEKRMDGMLLARYKESLEKIFDKILVMKNIFESVDEDSGFKNVRYTYFPYVLPTSSRKQKRKEIVFFGQPFLLAKNIPPKVYARKLNQIFKYLRKFYGNDYKLIYRPHPREEEELEHLNLQNFEIEKDGMMAELYFYKQRENIYRVFSVSSTVSRSALNFGIDAYSFMKLFSFKKSTKDAIKELMGKVPQNFWIDDLSKKAKSFKLGKKRKEVWMTFRKDLAWAIER